MMQGLIGGVGYIVAGCSLAGSPATEPGTPPVTSALATPTASLERTICIYQQHTMQVDDLAWSPDSKWIISISNGIFSPMGNGTASQIYLWDAVTGDSSITFANDIESFLLAPIAWSPDGSMIAFASQPSSGDGLVSTVIYNISSEKRTGQYSGQNGFINQLAWSPDSTHLAVAGQDDVEVCSADMWSKILTYPAVLSPGTTQPSNVVAWSPDGLTIASAAANEGHSLQFWDTNTGEPLYYFLGAKPDVAIWSPNGKMIAVGSTFGQIPQVLDSSTGEILLTTTAQTSLPTFGQGANTRYGSWRWPHTITWSPDNAYIAIATNQNHVEIWNVAKKLLTYTYTEHKGPVSAVAWSPNGSMIASASFDKTVRVWLPPARV